MPDPTYPTYPHSSWFSPTPEVAEGSAYFIDSVEEYGVYYDSETNVITLKNVKYGAFGFMCNGNSLTINVEGNCHLRNIIVDGNGHSAAIRFTGNGTLTLDGTEHVGALMIRSEFAQGCIMVDPDVTLKIGDVVEIHTSLLKDNVFITEPNKLDGNITTGAEEPYGQANQWILDNWMKDRDVVPTVYKTVITPGSSGYITISH